MSIPSVWQQFHRSWRRDRELQAVASDSADTTRARIIADIVAYCPEHGNKPTCRMTCHCIIAEELRKKEIKA